MESPLSMNQRFVVSFGSLVVCMLVLVSWERFTAPEVVIRDERVTVINRMPLENDTRLFYPGDECILRSRGGRAPPLAARRRAH